MGCIYTDIYIYTCTYIFTYIDIYGMGFGFGAGNSLPGHIGAWGSGRNPGGRGARENVDRHYGHARCRHVLLLSGVGFRV